MKNFIFYHPWSLNDPRTHSLGTSNSWVFANSISAAVWLAIVCFSRCCSDDTRAYIAAIFMNASPCWLRANEALSSGHQNVVRLGELILAQAIKHIVEIYLK